MRSKTINYKPTTKADFNLHLLRRSVGTHKEKKPPTLVGGVSLLPSGFVLLEIIVTVAILSLGLVLICRSFISSLDAAKISSDYTKATSLLENKLWELEMNEYINNYFVSQSLSENGSFGQGYEGFSWAYTINPLDTNSALEELELQVSWIKTRRKGKVDLTTYMYAPEE